MFVSPRQIGLLQHDLVRSHFDLDLLRSPYILGADTDSSPCDTSIRQRDKQSHKRLQTPLDGRPPCGGEPVSSVAPERSAHHPDRSDKIPISLPINPHPSPTSRLTTSLLRPAYKCRLGTEGGGEWKGPNSQPESTRRHRGMTAPALSGYRK